MKGKVFEVAGKEWTFHLGRLEIHKVPFVLWHCGKRHWLPANYSAEAHHQVRWLWLMITLWKRRWMNHEM